MTLDNEKIGLGIVTYKRPELLRKLLDSIVDSKEQWSMFKETDYQDAEVDYIVVVDDGGDLNPEDFLSTEWLKEAVTWITNEENLGVGKSKNKAFRELMCKGCEHYFIMEDDIYIKHGCGSVFGDYIKASKETGIQHFNFSQHGVMNKTFDGTKKPNPRFVLDYGNRKIALYPHCVGAFSYYSKKALDSAGLIDEQYVNACEHVDHTYEIIKKGLHPPFWYFADLPNSHQYLGDEEWSIEKSTISSKPNHKQMMADADLIFVKKHGCVPGQVPLVDVMVAAKELKRIKKEFSSTN